MNFIETLEANMPLIAGIVAVILLVLFLTAFTAWRLCKRTFTDLLESAEGRAVLAEERTHLADERAALSEERVSLLRDKIESLQPENFDAQIDDIISRIKDVEYSRLNGIISQLNEVKLGEPQFQAETADEFEDAAEHDAVETVAPQEESAAGPTHSEPPVPANEDTVDAYQEIFEPEQDDAVEDARQNLVSA